MRTRAAPRLAAYAALGGLGLLLALLLGRPEPAAVGLPLLTAAVAALLLAERPALEARVEIGPEPARQRREIAREYIHLVGLDRFSHSRSNQLSGGMRRVGLARALAVRPEILLMDELFASLDAHTRELLQFELLNILGRTRATIVFVTHSVDEALVLSDRISVFSRAPGHIIEMLDVNLPQPRDEAVKSVPQYAEMRQHIWEALPPPDDGLVR